MKISDCHIHIFNSIFGTDWPWFLHGSEVQRIEELMEKAGFGELEKEAVFSGNLENILGIINKD